MTTYEFHGSIRIEAGSYEIAENFLYEALKDYDLHINDVEEID
jgi:hypothetical protein